MGNLTNLPGVKGGELINVPFVRSVSGAMYILKEGRAVMGAGDFGAWTVWRDDEGNYRCEFSRHCIPKSELTTHTKAAVRQWLKEWVPAAHNSETTQP